MLKIVLCSYFSFTVTHGTVTSSTVGPVIEAFTNSFRCSMPPRDSFFSGPHSWSILTCVVDQEAWEQGHQAFIMHAEVYPGSDIPDLSVFILKRKGQLWTWRHSLAEDSSCQAFGNSMHWSRKLHVKYTNLICEWYLQNCSENCLFFPFFLALDSRWFG